ncbi:hypothetical protein EJ04DRAFT_58910 [Polyplosphaeria fusca]|uniref:Uncharacterized protein n=1 Tax=Polyplosphaeria fusca TaxID=682080 RepID=A0A9P4QQH4_9PLEO|nr:hypothetical protein EJ04DRAFT_58910 [Polyplosphaeria fusca]
MTTDGSMIPRAHGMHFPMSSQAYINQFINQCIHQSSGPCTPRCAGMIKALPKRVPHDVQYMYLSHTSDWHGKGIDYQREAQDLSSHGPADSGSGREMRLSHIGRDRLPGHARWPPLCTARASDIVRLFHHLAGSDREGPWTHRNRRRNCARSESGRGCGIAL